MLSRLYHRAAAASAQHTLLEEDRLNGVTFKRATNMIGDYHPQMNHPTSFKMMGAHGRNIVAKIYSTVEYNIFSRVDFLNLAVLERRADATTVRDNKTRSKGVRMIDHCKARRQ